MSRTRLLAAILAIAVPLVAQHDASGGVLIPEEACYDVHGYDLNLRVDPTEHTIDGSLAMQARTTAATRKLAMDLDDALDVHDVHVSSGEAEWRHEDGRIWIDLDKELAAKSDFTVTVDYGGKPRVAPMPPWRGGFTWQTAGGKPWIGTSCQGEGADLWWPCKDSPSDKPDHVDVTATVPGDLYVASNGTLVSDQKNPDGTRTFHWHEANPISNYCVTLNIAPYVVIEQPYTCVDGTQMPVRFYALPHDEERAREELPELIAELRFNEQTCGPYPFRNEKYGIVEAPFLGMEHQTLIAYGNHFRIQNGYDWLHDHEMSHEWWGNLVTCRDWKDMWIHEGIATYMQALYLEHKEGPEAYRSEMARERRQIVNRSAVAPRETQDSQEIYFGKSGNDIYFKGSWVMHTLRWLLGDDMFFKALHRMAYPTPESEKATDGSQVRLTDTEEIRGIVERVAGRDLKWFFEVYLRQPDLPELTSKTEDGVLHLQWKVPDDLPFPMPVPVKVGDKVVRVEMGKDGGEVKVGDAEVEIDPDHWLLMR